MTWKEYIEKLFESYYLAKEEGDKVSGLVHMIRGTHRHFPLGRKCVIDGCQRLIGDVRFWQTVETYRGAARQGVKIYLNELSRAELEKNDVKDLLNMCHFVEKRQLSGHNKAMGLKQFVKNVMENCKNFFKFAARKGKKLQVIGLHGNEAQRENSARALQNDKRIEFHNFANGDVIELKPGYSKVIKHINVEEFFNKDILQECFEKNEYINTLTTKWLEILFAVRNNDIAKLNNYLVQKRQENIDYLMKFWPKKVGMPSWVNEPLLV